MKTVFAATQIHNYSNKSYFQKFRLSIENPGNSREVILIPGIYISSKIVRDHGFQGSRDRGLETLILITVSEGNSYFTYQRFENSRTFFHT